jgi:hypothetical protein
VLENQQLAGWWTFGRSVSKKGQRSVYGVEEAKAEKMK